MLTARSLHWMPQLMSSLCLCPLPGDFAISPFDILEPVFSHIVNLGWLWLALASRILSHQTSSLVSLHLLSTLSAWPLERLGLEYFSSSSVKDERPSGQRKTEVVPHPPTASWLSEHCALTMHGWPQTYSGHYYLEEPPRVVPHTLLSYKISNKWLMFRVDDFFNTMWVN